MKSVPDREGSPVPEGESPLQSEIDRVKHELHRLEPSNRVAMLERLRWSLASLGRKVEVEDERVLELYRQGAVDYKHLVDHFGPWVRDIGIPGRS